jgi:putative endonuclease
MAESHETGSSGEIRAREYLEAQGFRILHTNWRFLHLEIDIAAMDGELLVIVEVKTRTSNEYGEPETFVTPQKQQKLIRAANHYLELNGLDNEVRFDIVSILSRDDAEQIRHIADAFGPTVK